MPTLELITPFVLGDTIITTVEHKDNGVKVVTYVMGVIVRIDFKVFHSSGRQCTEAVYSIVDSNKRTHTGITTSTMQTVEYFVQHEKHRLEQHAETMQYYIRKPEEETKCQDIPRCEV